MNYNYSIDDNNEHTGDGHRSIQRPPPKRQGTGLRPLRRRVLGTFYSYFFIVLKFIYMYIKTTLWPKPVTPKDDTEKNSPLKMSLRLEPLYFLTFFNHTDSY